jgi:NRPS condensation-like uncharacterized protein
VHVEVHASGTIDGDRLLAAATTASALHPMARASLAPVARPDRNRCWQIADRPSPPELEVFEVSDETALADVRERLLRAAPALDAPPPFKLALAHRAEGDALLLCVHHAACDGMASWRLMVSICRAYAGLEDPTPAFDPLQAREPRALVVPKSRRERLRRIAKLPSLFTGARSAPVRLAPRATARDGEGVFLLSLDERETAALEGHRLGGATLNDVMLGALTLAVRRWNSEHGGANGRVAIMVLANVRPKAWKEEVLGNFSSFIPFSIPASVPNHLAPLVAAATFRTQRGKRAHAPEAIFDVLIAILRRLSMTQKRRLRSLLFPQMHDRLQDTAILSNLGRLEIPDLGGTAGAVRAAWFTPPVRWTRGLGVGTIGIDGRLQVAFRHHRSSFDDEDAAAFAALFRDALLEGEEARRQAASGSS